MNVVWLLPLHAQPSDDLIPLVGWRFVTEWTWVWWAALPLLLSSALYFWGVRVLHQRGDRWPWYRTFAFNVLGMGTMWIALMSFLGTYDTVLFWIHMVQHMTLTMISPVFITQGAPVTLALRALPSRPRGWLLAFVHSGFAKVAMFPPLTTLFMISTPFALYMTPLYDYTLRNDWAHDTLHIWMVVMGCLFFMPILAIDPVPIRLPYPVRFLLVLLTMPFHAFLGTTIMGTTRLISEEWYVSFLRDWGPSPLSDQYWAGALLWATGDLTMLVTMSALAYQWLKDSQKEARQVDRALDREEEVQASHQRRLDRTPTHDAE